MKSGYRRGNKVTVGSTQSGKSYAELHDILQAADRRTIDGRRIAIVCCDPHKGSLARNALQHLIARGHKGRILWDELDELDHTLKYRFHIRSQSTNPARRGTTTNSRLNSRPNCCAAAARCNHWRVHH